MEYIDVDAARELPGLRLVLTRGVPGPFGMAARAILEHKQVPYTAVAQYPAQANEPLLAWTRHRNAPVAIYNDEAPRVGWLDILNLAERLGEGPALIPAEIGDRMRMIALINEISGEYGFAWEARIMMLGVAGPERAAEAAKSNPMFTQYGYSEDAAAAALPRLNAFIDMLSAQLRHQRDAGSDYLIGDQLTAADMHWVYFSQLLEPFPVELCPMPDGLRRSYESCGRALGEFDRLLIDHRDLMLQRYPSLPMDF